MTQPVTTEYWSLCAALGHRLSLTIEYKNHNYVALLDEWKPPPPIDAVEAALVTMLGKSVSRIGNVEVGVTSPPTRSDSAGY
jgi:hypothetical protein